MDHDPDKDIKHGELSRIFAAGGKVFPLFQTGGGSPTHFTPQRGAEVAEEAAVAAWGYRLPANSIIYFSVDYDAYDWEVTASIIPYFRAVNAAIRSWGRTYRVGIYGPRNVCKRVSAEELAVASFVSDMSTGYSGNLGHTMPTNWAFDQIRTLTVGSGGAAIEIDKNIVSGRDPGVSVLAAATNVGVDPLIPSHSFEAFAADWYDNCVRHRDSDVQLPIMALNRDAVKERVAKQDAFITRLAGDHGVYKAMILTPLIWESMVINVLDDAKDKDVNAHYVLRENGDSTALFPADDSSTGVCQIFARTAIDARNWAVGQGLLSGRLYNKTVWQDMWEIWKALHHDDEFNITTAMFIMMREAVTRTGVPADQLRNLTPSQVMRACSGYNGDGVYGRRRMTLFYLIQRWHEAFR